MIIQMSSGGYKVFTQDNVFVGAYNNEQLAQEIDRLGRPLTTQEFNNLFIVEKKRLKNEKQFSK